LEDTIEEINSDRRPSRPMRQEERTDRMRQVPGYPNLSPGMERAYSMQQDYEDHDTFADEPDPYVQEMTTPAELSLRFTLYSPMHLIAFNFHELFTTK
jgi:hypothetical protein